MKIPTIREIASATGFSVATVSRALANNTSLSTETRNRIRTVAKTMGWQPNPMASAYMAHLRSTKPPVYQATLAYVISFPDKDLLVEYHELNFQGAAERAASLGYSLEMIWLRDLQFNFEALAALLKSRGIPGLILNGEGLPPGSFTGFDWSSFASATWGFSVSQPMLHQAGYHHMHGIRMILQKLRELGYQRTAMIISEDHDELADHALLSAFSYQENHHSPDEWIKSYNLSSWHSNREERKKIQVWLRQHKPEVVIGEKIAWEAIEEMGWKVPEDIAFVSPIWSSKWPNVGGVNHLPRVMGSNTVDLVVAQLLRNERGIPENAKLVLNQGRWVDGPSIPANKDRSSKKPSGPKSLSIPEKVPVEFQIR